MEKLVIPTDRFFLFPTSERLLLAEGAVFFGDCPGCVLFFFFPDPAGFRTPLLPNFIFLLQGGVSDLLRSLSGLTGIFLPKVFSPLPKSFLDGAFLFFFLFFGRRFPDGQLLSSFLACRTGACVVPDRVDSQVPRFFRFGFLSLPLPKHRFFGGSVKGFLSRIRWTRFLCGGPLYGAHFFFSSHRNVSRRRKAGLLFLTSRPGWRCGLLFSPG